MSSLERFFKHTDLLLGAALLVVVSMLILPIPTWLIDLGLVLALASAVIIMLATVNVDDPLKFSVFPSLLLLTTLFRLSLSIGATKLILGQGEGGRVIETFGNFIMGGDFVVGFVAFLILMIVQFIVITNGAGRVAEVAARFTLDAMPGKQMAIDADLAAGLIDENQARHRRKQIKQEADFYGAMDGASKFVKGDAIAALLIILVNIIGGFVVGYMRGGGDALAILKTYTLLSVGEGLVAQIPALLISTAAGLLVTRAGQERGMGTEVIGQVLGQPKALASAGIAIAAFALVPGFPATIFLSIGGLLLGLSRFLASNPDALKGTTPESEEELAALAGQQPLLPTGPDAMLALLSVDPLEIEIGFSLTPLADPRAGGDLPDRVASTRKQIVLELGYVMPSVRIRDSFNLSAYEYIINLRGEEVARAEAFPGKFLAISNSGVLYPIPGQPTKEPVFNLEAYWIDPDMREQADKAGYTVVEPSAMIATHLSEIVKTNAAELLSRQDVMKLIDQAKTVNETIVNELVPSVCPVGDVQKVLQHLLREGVPIRDMVTILETMADFAARGVKEPDQLGELVRAAMARTITRQNLGPDKKLHCITLEPSLERGLTEALTQSATGARLALEPTMQQKLLSAIQQEVNHAAAMGLHPVLLCGTTLRLPLRRLLEMYQSVVPVLAHHEVAASADVEFVGMLQAA